MRHPQISQAAALFIPEAQHGAGSRHFSSHAEYGRRCLTYGLSSPTGWRPTINRMRSNGLKSCRERQTASAIEFGCNPRRAGQSENKH